MSPDGAAPRPALRHNSRMPKGAPSAKPLSGFRLGRGCVLLSLARPRGCTPVVFEITGHCGPPRANPLGSPAACRQGGGYTVHTALAWCTVQEDKMPSNKAYRWHSLGLPAT